MSISTALSNAYSGLSAVSRAAETVSNNVSNALTEGYTRQEVAYSAASLGGQGAGVRIDGISRSIDVVGTAARQRAETSLTYTSTLEEAANRLTQTLGEPGSQGALAVRYTAFEDSISSSVSAPDSKALQRRILTEAKHLASSFKQMSTETTRVRIDADAEIARQVQIVNSSLKRIEDLNSEIRMLATSGRNIATLEDQRQVLVDQINQIIPIKQSQTGAEEIAIFTTAGAILLNDSARELKFNPTALMTPAMSLVSGALSGLSLNGIPLDINQMGGRLDGGSLSASFHIRDTIAPEFQRQIDGLARDLIERFQDPSADPTLATGDAGFFTDNGTAFLPINETGIAGRITVNAGLDPSAGGELWRIRDGIGAATSGAVGQSAQLLRLHGALNSFRSDSGGMGVVSLMDATGFAEEITSFWFSEAAQQNESMAQKAALFDALRIAELGATGVDTDREMELLLIVEQAYAANARVISVIDGLMKTLLEM